MVPVSQTFTGLGAATKDWLARIGGSTKDAPRIRHGGNPILRWMAANLVVDTNGAGDLKPSNERSTERITGQTAAIIALGRLVAPHEAEPAEPGILGLLRSMAGPVPERPAAVPAPTGFARLLGSHEELPR
jgi:phage terminase large subunit-like protein